MPRHFIKVFKKTTCLLNRTVKNQGFFNRDGKNQFFNRKKQQLGPGNEASDDLASYPGPSSSSPEGPGYEANDDPALLFEMPQLSG